MTIDEILEQEYSEKFDAIRKKQMVVSYFKYGAVKHNHHEHKCMDTIGSLELRLAKYKETGNTEFLADVANFAMMEFMYPKHPNAHFEPTDSGACEIKGFGINEVKNFDKIPNINRQSPFQY